MVGMSPAPCRGLRRQRRLRLDRGRRSTGGAGKPVRGGTLKAGFVGGGTAETLNPYAGVTPDRRVARAEPLRPALDPEPRPLDQPRPRDRDERERRRDRVRGQAPPGRRVPQRQDVHRRRPDLLDPAHVQAGQLRVGAVRGRDQPRRAEGGQRRPPSAIPLKFPDADLGRQLRLLEHVDRPGRRDRLQEAGRHRPVHVRVVRAGHPEHVQGQPELLGHRQAVRRLALRSPRSTTTPPG